MHLRSSTHSAFTFLFIFFLASCSGGGSNTSSSVFESTPAQLKNYYEDVAEDTYQGKTSPAKMTEQLSKDTYSYSYNRILIPTLPYQAFIELNSWRDNPDRDSDSTSFTSECGYQGSVAVVAEVESDDVTIIEAEYSNCGEWSDTYNSEAAYNGLVSLRMEVRDGIYIYHKYIEQFRIDVDERNFSFSGFVEHSFDNHRDEYSHQVYITQENLTDDLSVMLNLAIDGDYLGDRSVVGSVYLEEEGKVDVSTPTPLSSQYDLDAGRVEFKGQGGESFAFEVLDYRTLRIERDTDGDGSFDDGALVSSYFKEFVSSSDAINAYADLDTLTLPPRAGSPYINLWRVSTSDDIVVEPGSYEDQDTAKEDLVVDYLWYINDREVVGNNSNTLPAYTATGGDVVSVAMRVSDGVNAAISSLDYVTLIDSPGYLEITGAPSSAEAGEIVEFYALQNDPDLPSSQSSANMVSAPHGATINDTGLVSWKVPDESVGMFSAWVAAFRFETGDIDKHIDSYSKEVNELTVKVTISNSSASQPLVRSGFEAPEKNRSIHVGNFLVRDGNEILSTDNQQRVFLLSATDDGFEQSWMYPYSLAIDEDEKIVQTLAANMDADGYDEIIVLTNRRVFVIEGPDQLAKLLWQTDDYIRSATIRGSFTDGSIELAVITNENDYSNANSTLVVLEIFDDVSTVFTSPLSEKASEVLFGDVDSDNSLELVTNDGYVFDTASWKNEWFSGTAFGDSSLALVDFDGSGKMKIVGSDRWGSIAVYDAATKTLLASIDNLNVCALNSGDLDQDSSEELLVGDCQRGKISGYGLVGGNLVSEWETDAYGYGTSSVIVANVDDDKHIEVVWSSPHSARKSSFVVTEYTGNFALQWRAVDPAQLNTFATAGWGNVELGQEQAIFIVPSTDGSYEGQHLAFVDSAGSLTVSDRVSNNWTGGDSGVVTDLHNDGLYDVFLNTAQIREEGVAALQLNDLTEHWSLEAGSRSNIEVVDAYDFNGDISDEVVYVQGNKVTIVDIVNQVLVDAFTHESASKLIKDMAIGHGDQWSDPVIITATNESLKIWESGESGYSESQAIDRSCLRIVLFNADNDGDAELACSTALEYETAASIVIYDYVDGQFTEMTRHVVSGNIVDMTADISTGADQALLLAISEGDYWSNGETNISSIDASTGAYFWTSPALLGKVVSRSMKMSLAPVSGKPRLMFATSFAMYVIQ